jgi:hypothetical protein
MRVSVVNTNRYWTLSNSFIRVSYCHRLVLAGAPLCDLFALYILIQLKNTIWNHTFLHLGSVSVHLVHVSTRSISVNFITLCLRLCRVFAYPKLPVDNRRCMKTSELLF